MRFSFIKGLIIGEIIGFATSVFTTYALGKINTIFSLSTIAVWLVFGTMCGMFLGYLMSHADQIK